MQVITDQRAGAALTLVTYDYILTFQQERRLIWNSKWSYGKVLFLCIRYATFLALPLFSFVQFGRSVSQLSCAVSMYIFLSLALVVVLCGSLVLALRTWALWNRSPVCGTILCIAWCSVAVLTVTFLILTDTSLLTDENAAFPNLAGCGVVFSPSASSAVIKMCISLAGYEGLIFFMTVIRGLRYLHTRAPLILTLYRDAFFASSSLLAVTITAASLSSGHSDRFYVPYVLTIAFYVVTPCRIILNLREATTYVDGWDLATTRVQHTEEEGVASDASGWS